MGNCRNFLKDEDGATAIEYGLIAGIISTALLAGFTDYSSAIGTHFTEWAEWFKDKKPS